MMMEKTEKKRIKDKILEEMKNLKTTMTSLEESAKPVAPDVAIGRLTRMEAINSKEINEANLRSSRSRLSMLQSALDRLDDPDFGICVECEEPIVSGRLLVMPESRRCVECAGKPR